MREMKDSGIDWLGKVPAKWNIKRLKQILQERNEKNNPIKSTNLLSLSIERGVFPYSEKTGGGNKAKANFEDYKLTYPNDIVLNSMNVVVGAVGKSNYFGCISPVYYTLFSKNDNYNIDYYNEIFQSEAFQKSLWGLGNGIVVKESDNGKLNTIRMRIPMEKLNNVLLPIPTKEEQNRIAKFLDEKITKIDNIIAKTKQTIEDYKLYKQAVITKAVTKGLDEKVETKDSGIEWIGKIPLTWKVERIKDIASLKTGTTPNTSNQEWFDGDLNWFTPGDFHEDYVMKKSARKLSLKAKEENVATIIPEDTTLIIGIGGTAGKIGYVEEECSCNQQITAIISNKVYNKYIMYWMIANTKFLKETALYTTLPIINNDTLGKYIFLNPKNIDEEIMIVNYLDKKCNELDVLIKSKENLITELENYKKSLIYEYVTGKKEVDEKKIYNTNNISGIKINCKDNVFAQAILLCKIIEKLKNYNLGRVKAEKILYLIEQDVGFEFNNKYVREAAGPLSDNIYKCESIISKNKWVNIKKVKKYIEYEILPNFNKYSKYYDKYFSNYDSQIGKIIDIVKNYSTDKAEMVATLYASWNDFIIKKDKVSEIEIVRDVRENWNDRKKRFNEREWLEVLEEMKQNGLTPKGNGNLTIIKE